MMTKLENTVDIIDYLGGNDRVANMLGTTAKAVANWRYSGMFPASTYVALRKALRRARANAPDALWAMKPLLKAGRKR